VTHYLELTKARLSAMVVFSTAVGFVLASAAAGPIDWLSLLWTVLGTALAAGSANGLNQVLEMHRDRRMVRTAGRPLPSGAMRPAHAVRVATTLGVAGVLVLALLVNAVAAGLALLTILLYTLVYTPLKSRTSLNTVVGAVCGAMPPLIGWTGATSSLPPAAWLLAALLFVWQLPHFMALAWMYRDDYARGGFVMLPNVDERGEITARVMTIGCLTLVLIGLVSPLLRMSGWIFVLGSVGLGLWMCSLSLLFYQRRSHDAARRLFRGSLVYLASVFVLLMVDRGPLPTADGNPPVDLIVASRTVPPVR
jgi:protoheme IX farnesyltransferase